MDKKTTTFDIREIGQVKSVREFIVRAVNMPSCIVGQMVDFSNGARGLVMGFSENEIQILVLDSKVDIRAGDEVYSKGEPLLLPAGEGFIGRVVDGLAQPVDDSGPIEPDGLFSVFRDAPGVMHRIPVEKTFETGTTVLDSVIPIAKGQRQLLIGDRLTGKTTVAIDAILNQKGKDVICIYCCVGKPYSGFVRVLDLLRERGAMDYTICVSGAASTSAGEQYLAPYTACMLGEYFMHSGRDVFIVFDDLTKHAWVYRQISLLLERAPGREAYPGDIFYIHSQLMERAGYLNKEHGGGSMTFFPIIDILQGDVTGYISSNLVSMTDGQIYFDSALFYKGFKPAIDLGLSVSRIGSKGQWNGMKDVSKSIRLEYLQYLELLQITQLHAGTLSKEAEESYRRNQIIGTLLVQDKNRPVPVEQQIIYFFAWGKGLLDNLTEEDIGVFKEKIFTFAQSCIPKTLVRMRGTEEFTEDDRIMVDKCVRHYISGGLPGPMEEELEEAKKESEGTEEEAPRT